MLFLRVLFLLFDRKSEVSELLAEREILSVSKGGKPCLLKTKLSFFVDQLFVNVNCDDVGKEHVVTAELDNIGHLALKRERTLGDKRTGDLARLLFGKSALFKLVYLRARVDAAIVRRLYE